MSTAQDPRHVARAIALEKLFIKLSAHQEIPADLDILEELEVSEFDKELEEKIVTGVLATYTYIDPIIEELAPAWPKEQIAPINLNIIRMGIWEGFIAELNNVSIVIDEMVELAKQFGTETNAAFVNGVLGGLALNLQLQDKLIKSIEDLDSLDMKMEENSPEKEELAA